MIHTYIYKSFWLSDLSLQSLCGDPDAGFMTDSHMDTVNYQLLMQKIQGNVHLAIKVCISIHLLKKQIINDLKNHSI